MDRSTSSYSVSLCRPQVPGGSSGTGAGGVKIGGLWKRSQGISRFTKPNYKHRVFILTEQALTYYSGTVDRIGQLKGRVTLESVRAVEFVEQSAFCLAHTMQIVYQTKKNGFVTLYVTATDRRECSDWVSTLRQVCYFNKDMLMHYHPGAMLKGKWSCCKQAGKTSLGCQPTYHLLTRSSSRYAQMRRRDTLTGSRQNSRKRTRSSAGAYGTLDRRSLASSNRVSEAIEVQNGVQKSTAGLSNSCVDLTLYPPHGVESFALEECPSSQRSSQVSNEPSVGVASVTLTRVSMNETTPIDCSHDLELDQYQTTQQSSKVDKWHNRSKVAPESNFNITRDHQAHTTRQGQQQTLEKKPTKLKQSPLTQSHDHPPHSNEKHNQSNESHVSASPIPPPRHKRLNPSLPISLHSSTHYIPSTQSSGENSRVNIEYATSSLGRLKHSKTFALSHSTDPVAEPHLRPHLKGFSHSMHALTKPVIEPKLSLTNPNMVHV